MPELHELAEALERYAKDHSGAYPDHLETLLNSDSRGGPYFERRFIPKDIWGRPYLYDPPSAGHDRPRVYTYGRDGQPGGEGDDADIDNLSLPK